MIEIIWKKKYKRGNEKNPKDTFLRVAKAVAQGAKLTDAFFEEMASRRFIPGGRILAYSGSGNPKATLANCFVMGQIDDSMEGIMTALHESAITMKAGGGIGLNFSTLRPYGSGVSGTSSISSGPVSFMEMWNSMSRTISGVGDRKGAMIAVLNIDHPDIEKFIMAKFNNTTETPTLEKFNISVGITDAFMKAVEDDADWDLKFNEITRTVKARELWELIVRNAWAKAEPGVLFLDNINKVNNLWYCEEITACNPCGEQPLPPYGACTLGSINLVQFIIDPFGQSPSVDIMGLKKTVQIAVRFLDNTIDINYYPIPKQATEATQKRRIGLGIMGLGSALAMLKVRYGSERSLEVVDTIFKTIRDTAYLTSVTMAKEKGAFPLFDSEKYLQGEFIKRLPEEIRNAIKESGIRNSHLLTIAPTGSIAQLVGNVSSGVEPIFSLEYSRRNYNEDILVEDYAWKLYKEMGYPDGEKPEYFVTAHELSWREHLKVMAKCQEYIDSSISKTINVPKETTIRDLYEVYHYAWSLGLKGCTIYREGSLDVEILKKEQPHQVKPGRSHRPYRLEGKTYKVKPPESKHAYYLTFTHSVVDGKRVQPLELFINTKNPFVEEWVKALGRLISSVFRNVDDPTFLVEELKEIMGKTGFWSAPRRKYVPSLIAEFGEVMRDYFEEIGLTEPEVPIEIYESEPEASINNSHPHLAFCHACGQQAAVYEEGCLKCFACGYNKCG